MNPLPLAAAMSLGLASSACSFAMTRPPRTTMAPQERVECTQSAVPPVLDGLATVFLGLVTGAAVDISETGKGLALLGFGGVTALYAAATVTGARSAHRCRQMLALDRECREGTSRACMDLQLGRAPPPPPGRAAKERCTHDDDCAPWMRCRSGRCGCGVDADCPATQRCRAGTCLHD